MGDAGAEHARDTGASNSRGSCDSDTRTEIGGARTGRDRQSGAHSHRDGSHSNCTEGAGGSADAKSADTKSADSKSAATKSAAYRIGAS